MTGGATGEKWGKEKNKLYLGKDRGKKQWWAK